MSKNQFFDEEKNYDPEIFILEKNIYYKLKEE